MKFLILLSFISLASCKMLNEAHSKDVDETRRKIIGGTEVTTVIHYQAALVSTKNNMVFCGGSIISRNWILTAAHCMPNQTLQTFYVRVGSLRYDTGGQAVRVRRIIPNPNYNDNTSDFDVALLQVNDIQFNNQVYPIQLPRANQLPPDGTTVMVSGWGNTFFTTLPLGPLKLRAVTMQITNFKRCQQMWERNEEEGEITERMICASGKGKTSCAGDSGGPLADGNTLVGIVSFGKDCSDELPGAYTNVANRDIRRFIKERSGV